MFMSAQVLRPQEYYFVWLSSSAPPVASTPVSTCEVFLIRLPWFGMLQASLYLILVMTICPAVMVSGMKVGIIMQVAVKIYFETIQPHLHVYMYMYNMFMIIYNDVV